MREPFSLCAVDPATVELLDDLYGQLLPHFTSRQLNVGLDETWDLGTGRSKAACDERGTGRVYLEFLNKLYALTRRYGVTMQFWSDIIVRDEPELMTELPRDVIAMEWGYEADYPFAEHAALLAASGRSFYVCPGTSSWNTLVGPDGQHARQHRQRGAQRLCERRGRRADHRSGAITVIRNRCRSAIWAS